MSLTGVGAVSSPDEFAERDVERRTHLHVVLQRGVCGHAPRPRLHRARRGHAPGRAPHPPQGHAHALRRQHEPHYEGAREPADTLRTCASHNRNTYTF